MSPKYSDFDADCNLRTAAWFEVHVRISMEEVDTLPLVVLEELLLLRLDVARRHFKYIIKRRRELVSKREQALHEAQEGKEVPPADPAPGSGGLRQRTPPRLA
jgi:hypothetical protein